MVKRTMRYLTELEERMKKDKSLIKKDEKKKESKDGKREKKMLCSSTMNST